MNVQLNGSPLVSLVVVFFYQGFSLLFNKFSKTTTLLSKSTIASPTIRKWPCHHLTCCEMHVCSPSDRSFESVAWSFLLKYVEPKAPLAGLASRDVLLSSSVIDSMNLSDPQNGTVTLCCCMTDSWTAVDCLMPSSYTVSVWLYDGVIAPSPFILVTMRSSACQQKRGLGNKNSETENITRQ